MVVRGRHGLLVLVLASSLAAQQWQRLPATMHPPRGDVAMATDPLRQRLVCVIDETMFQFGPHSSITRCTTWEWDGLRWSLRATPTSLPSNGEPHSMVWDPTRGRVLRMGYTGGTWSYDGVDWRQEQFGFPSGLAGGNLCFDAARGVVVAVDYLWLYELVGSTWQQRATIPGVYFSRAGFDPSTGTVLLFGGYDYGTSTGYVDRTWSWNGVALTERFPATVPLGRFDHHLTVDPATGRLLLLGGTRGLGYLADVHAWNGSDWVPQPPLPSPASSLGAAPFGGVLHVLDHDWRDLHVRTATGWNAVPLPAAGRVAAHDTVRARTVSIDGTRTLEFDGATWTDTGVAFPSAFPAVALAFHPGSARVVAVDRNGGTWTFDGLAWSAVPTAFGPSPRSDPGFALHPGSGMLVLAGGIDGATAFDDLWEWNGAQWNSLPSPLPLVAGPAALGFDPAGQTLVRFAGASYRLVAGTWVPLPNPTVFGYSGSLAADATTLWLGATPGGPGQSMVTLRLTPAGWQPGPPGVDLSHIYPGTLVFDTNLGAVVSHDWLRVRDFVLTSQAASAVGVGSGCSLGSLVPALVAATLPQTGGTLVLDVLRAASNGAAFLFVDTVPAAVSLPNGCVQHVANPLLAAALATGVGGSASVAVPLPLSPALQGLVLYCQALTTAANGALGGFADLSNGLRLQFGH